MGLTYDPFHRFEVRSSASGEWLRERQEVEIPGFVCCWSKRSGQASGVASQAARPCILSDMLGSAFERQPH